MHELIPRRRPPIQARTLVLNALISALALLAYGWLRWPVLATPGWAVSWPEAVAVSLGSAVAVGVLTMSLLTLATRSFDKAHRTISAAEKIPLVEMTLIRPAHGALDPLDCALAAFEQPVRAPKWRDVGVTPDGVDFVPNRGTRVTRQPGPVLHGPARLYTAPLHDSVNLVPHLGWSTVGETDGGITFTLLPGTVDAALLNGTFAETEQEKTEPRLFTHEYTPRHGLALDYPQDRDV